MIKEENKSKRGKLVMGTIDIYKEMKKRWPSNVVVRADVGRFTGGILSPGSAKNIDSYGKGIPGAMRVGKKIVYSVDGVIEYLKSQTRTVAPRIIEENNVMDLDNRGGGKIIGAKNIAAFMGRAYIALQVWKTYHGFPIKYENFRPVLRIDDLDIWVQKHGGNLDQITTESIKRDKNAPDRA
jgi:hypothetical protein